MELGPVIAGRVLILDSEPKVVARIGLPFTPPEYPGESWCPWQIEGIGDEIVRRAIGIDSIQALWLALRSLGSSLYASEEYRAGRLVPFAGDTRGDLGFPIFSDFADRLPPRD